VPRLRARRTTGPITVDGALTEPDWADADWSPAFGRIASGVPSSPETRVAFRWDDDALYAAYRVQHHDIRGYTTRHHEHVYVKDDDVELFVSGERNYYELGINPINTIYEIGWYWMSRSSRRRLRHPRATDARRDGSTARQDGERRAVCGPGLGADRAAEGGACRRGHQRARYARRG
jgi:hypothetical protein